MLKKLYLILIVLAFIGGFALAGYLGRTNVQRERERASQVTADLRATAAAQQSAAERADRLQKELDTAYRRIGELQKGFADLQERFDQFIKTVGEVFGGLDRIGIGLGEGQGLIDECGNILRDIQNRGPTKN